jgi:hypothetical protein
MHHKKGLVEWLKVEALSSNPSTKKKITFSLIFKWSWKCGSSGRMPA